MDATLNRVIAGRDISIAPPALRAGGLASTARRRAAQESLTLRYQGLNILKKDYGNERIMKQRKSVEWYCKYSNPKLSGFGYTSWDDGGVIAGQEILNKSLFRILIY